MSNPPIPILPPASELVRYNSFPPDFLSPLVRYEADEEAQHFVYDAWETDSVPQRISLLREALRIFPFSVDALNAWANVYLKLCDPPELLKAEATYQMALTAARLLWPDLENQKKIEWGHTEHRPFLRAYHGLGRVQKELGKYDEAIKKFRFLLKVNPSDNQGARELLFNTLIHTGDCKQAEEVAEKYSNGRESIEAYVRYGFVLVDFLKFKLGMCSETDLRKTLVLALLHNNHVPALLLGDLPLPELPKYVSPGGQDEATSIVAGCKPSWERTPGILEWLREQQQLCGKKSDDDGAVLFELLQNGNVMVRVKDKDRPLELTTKVDSMPGKGLADFYLAPGMKEHNPAKIVAFDQRMARNRDVSSSQRFVSFSYDEVVSVHFWKILQTSNVFGEQAHNKH